MCVALYGYGRLAGPLPLTGRELVAEQPADVGRRVGEFLEGAGGRGQASGGRD
jgi:hypothetical protein